MDEICHALKPKSISWHSHWLTPFRFTAGTRWATPPRGRLDERQLGSIRRSRLRRRARRGI